MAADFIKINTTVSTQTYAATLKGVVADTRRLIDNLELLKGVMEHNIDSADYSAVETVFGLPTGNGDEVYNLVSGTLAGIKGTAQAADALTLIDRVG